jgi:hypothetical protein
LMAHFASRPAVKPSPGRCSNEGDLLRLWRQKLDEIKPTGASTNLNI